jgi:hypothetical protein
MNVVAQSCVPLESNFWFVDAPCFHTCNTVRAVLSHIDTRSWAHYTESL